ncbi:MAG TPA: hypothetical protein VFN64_08345 [Burkholderiaceae bacterium]|nr:hypothetical protein [Burkholderiaceae bacterium]
MIKPVELLVISAVSFGAATLHNTPAAAVGVRPVGVRTIIGSSFAALMATQHALAAASQRQRTSSECGLQGARDRARAVGCS